MKCLMPLLLNGWNLTVKLLVTAMAAISVIDRYLTATAISVSVYILLSPHICVSGSFSSDYPMTAKNIPVENVTAAVILLITVTTLSVLIAKNSDMSARHALMKNCVVYARSLRIAHVSALTLGTGSLPPPRPLPRTPLPSQCGKNKSNRNSYAIKNRLSSKNRGKNLCLRKSPPCGVTPLSGRL